MRKYFLLFGFMILIEFLYIEKSYGDGYAVLTGGYPGKCGSLPDIGKIEDKYAFSLGGEFGWKWEPFLLGIGMARIFSKTDWKLTYQGSGSSYTRVDNYHRHIAEDELFMAMGIPVSKGLTIKSTVGYSMETIQFKSYSYGTGDIEWPNDYGDGHFSISGQLHFEKEGFVIDFGYHNRRGVILGIGFTFQKH